MNQKELAKAAGVTPVYLNALINGRRNPSAKLANNLQGLTNISRDLWLFGPPHELREAWKLFRQRQREIAAAKARIEREHQ